MDELKDQEYVMDAMENMIDALASLENVADNAKANNPGWKRYVKPFQESEVKDYGINHMNLDEVHKRTVRLSELIQAIHDLRRRKEIRKQSVNGFPGTFPKIRAKDVNNIDTLNRAILRMVNSYYSELKKTEDLILNKVK